VDGPRALSISTARGLLAGRSFYQLAVGAIVLVAAVCVLVNFPHALRSLHQRVALNVSKGTPGRELVATDGLGISQQFIEEARAAVPRDAAYTVLDPSATSGVAPTTRAALAPYLRFVLFPRRQVDARDGQWLLCYLCDRNEVRGNVVWSDGNGLLISQVSP
jgi:hypothetical protein